MHILLRDQVILLRIISQIIIDILKTIFIIKINLIKLDKIYIILKRNRGKIATPKTKMKCKNINKLTERIKALITKPISTK